MRITAERDLARRVLMAVYNLRNAIRATRILEEQKDNKKTDALKKIHEMKIEKVNEALAIFDAEFEEADAVWKDDPANHAYRVGTAQLRSFATLLIMAVWQYYTTNADTMDTDAMDGHDVHSVLFSYNPTFENQDDFSNDLDKAVDKIKSVLVPKLKLEKVRPRKWKFGRRKK